MKKGLILFIVAVFSCSNLFAEVKNAKFNSNNNLGWTNLTEQNSNVAPTEDKNSPVSLSMDINTEYNFNDIFFMGIKGNEKNKDITIFKRIVF